jgi:hypothetical protein
MRGRRPSAYDTSGMMMMMMMTPTVGNKQYPRSLAQRRQYVWMCTDEAPLINNFSIK